MNFGIRTRLLIAAALPAIVVVALLLIGFINRHSNDLVEAMQDRGLASARQLGVAAEFPLFANHRDGLQRLTDAAKAGDATMRGAAIFGADSKQRSLSGTLSSSPASFGAQAHVAVGKTLLVSVPIRAAMPLDDLFSDTGADTAPDPEGKLLGYAVVELSLDRLGLQQQDLLAWALVTTCIGMLIAVLLSTLIASSVTGPIERISAVVAHIGQGDLEARVPSAESGALAPLANGINAMAARVAVTQEELRHQVNLATEELRQQKEAAELAARIDPLTGVASRRAFTETAEGEILRATRYGTPLSLIMVDLDHFKSINDTFGHLAGDAVLAHFARTITQAVREVDLVGRLGGEEFAVLLPGTSAAEAVQAAERMRAAVAESRLHARGQQLTYSASFGVAAFDQLELSFSEFLARADAALYRAKAQGRNRVELAATGTA
jgi:diguanylate cyclase (GGDEF)-like protein